MVEPVYDEVVAEWLRLLGIDEREIGRALAS